MEARPAARGQQQQHARWEQHDTERDTGAGAPGAQHERACQVMEMNGHVREACAQLEAGAEAINLDWKNVEDAGAETLAAALARNTTLKKLFLARDRIGPGGAQALAAALDNNATLTELSMYENDIGAKGAVALAAALGKNTALATLDLSENSIGVQGALALVAALDTNATLTSLTLERSHIGAAGARALAAALDTNHTLRMLYLLGDGVDTAITNLVADRLRVNKLVLTMAAWVAGTVAKINEVPFSGGRHLGLPPSFAELVAVMAFGDELLDRVLPYPAVDQWLTPGGRKFAAA